MRCYRRGAEEVHILVEGRLVRFAHVAQPRNPRNSGLRRLVSHVEVKPTFKYQITIHGTKLKGMGANSETSGNISKHVVCFIKQQQHISM